ncbi:MAG: hypothetical protein QOC62_4924 [Mycobacterium sp.]|nr:hypothetical protein [Mycobacterium sp.]
MTDEHAACAEPVPAPYLALYVYDAAKRGRAMSAVVRASGPVGLR